MQSPTCLESQRQSGGKCNEPVYDDVSDTAEMLSPLPAKDTAFNGGNRIEQLEYCAEGHDGCNELDDFRIIVE